MLSHVSMGVLLVAGLALLAAESTAEAKRAGGPLDFTAKPPTEPARRRVKPVVDPSTAVARPVQGISMRLSYRTLSLPEASSTPSMTGFRSLPEGTMTDDRFHGLSFEIYPASWYFRFGLATQLMLETAENDWMATEGLNLGFQWPDFRLGWTPYLEGGVHFGLGRRSFFMTDDRARTDASTLLYAFALDLGVDRKMVGNSQASLALGIQRTTFFGAFGGDGDVDALDDATTVTAKVGIGF